jgi:hypothetical protein
MFGVRRDSLTYDSRFEQHVHSAERARRNAVERPPARSVCGEDCPMSATSHICLEALGRGTSMLLPPEPLDSLGIMAHDLQPLLPKRQVVPRYRVHQMYRAVYLILI